jgi:N-acyl-D-amino-acid deacylase
MGVTRRSRSLLETNAVSRIRPVFYGVLTALLIGHAAMPAVAQPPDGNFLGERRVNAIMREILAQYRMAGASLAIAKVGQLLMARGYGLADVASGERATADTLFCTASVSKPFTAVAILKLVDQGRLALDTRLMDVLSDLQPLPGYGVVDPRFGTITVHKLLYHSGGWDRGGPPNAEAIVRRAGIRAPMSAELAYRVALSQPLAYTPGTEARYSNFGFVMLRLVVERAGGQRFEPFVKQNILAPMGITQMRLEPAEPRYAPGEAHRYAPGGRRELPGGHGHEMGADGANWIASAGDLVRFLVAVDGTAGSTFLSPAINAQMLAVPPPPLPPRKNGSHFGLGWDTVSQEGTTWDFSKNGGKPGVMTWLEHRPNGVDWALMFNTGFDKSSGRENPVTLARERIGEVLDRLE